VHIPDGVLKPEVWVPLAAASAGAVAVAARAARKRLAGQCVPLVGVMGAFVFALQMLNFPIAAGVSDHIVGAGLLAIAFGPSVAVLCMSAIIVIQALLFGDGGITALGANLFDMAIVSTLVAYAVYTPLARRLPVTAAALASLVAVLAGAAGAALWVVLSQPYGTRFFLAMLLTHLVSGAVEAVVTVAVVKALRSASLLCPAREVANA
jgi:cobalt/nickel transport system permease protein